MAAGRAAALFFEDLPALLGGETALALALSGGGDSTALLVLALEARRRFSLRLIAATVDHGLRPEARVEAEQVAALCAARGVPHRILSWEGPKPEANLQAAARTARLDLLRRWREGEGVRTLALGHTLDDAAETFLMRLARGSGVDGLSLMAAARADGLAAPGALPLRLIRPLLRCRRADLRAVCREAGVAWIEDPSNAEDRFLRVRARAALTALAPLGLAAEDLYNTARRLGRARTALERATAALLETAAVLAPLLGMIALDAAALRAAPEEVALRALARCLEWASAADYPPRLEKLEAALAAILEGGAGRTLHGAALAPLGDGRWAVFRELSAAVPPAPVEETGALWDGRFVAEPWAARGLMIGALGEAGAAEATRRLSRGGAPPESWRSAPLAARRAAPGIFDVSGALLSAPAAGLLCSEAPRISPSRPFPPRAADERLDESGPDEIVVS